MDSGHINPWMILPFGLLLASFALGPLFFPDWWSKHYPKVAFGLAGVTLAYYLFGLQAYGHVLKVGHEYLSFIALIGSLFVVSGGIHINVNRAPRDVRARETAHEEWRFDGLSNVLFLAVILCAVFVNNPPFLREALMIGAAVGSYFTTKKAVHLSNHFNFHPIKEVAILF